MRNSNSSIARKSHPCPMLKLLGDMFRCCNATDNHASLDRKVERKMIEKGRKRESRNRSFRSINGIITRFPQFKKELEKISATFEQFDKDSNGVIDHEELRNGLQKSDLNLTEQEIDDLLCSCDVDGKGGLQFNEFVVLLGLFYFLVEPSTSSIKSLPGIGSRQLEATFDSIVEAFLFMDTNGDGKLNKEDMSKAMDDAPLEKSPSYLTKTRFKEMDRNKNGTVTFREFLFALTSWLGLDTHDEVLVTSP